MIKKISVLIVLLGFLCLLLSTSIAPEAQAQEGSTAQSHPLSISPASASVTWTISFDSPSSHIRALAVYGGNLYASGFDFAQDNGRVYRFNGSTWTDINFASAIGVTVDQIESLQVFNNRLYIGTRVNVGSSKFVRVYYYDGTTFTQDLSKPGVAGFSGIESFGIHNNTLYATNSSPIGEVYQRNSDNNWSTLGGTIEAGSPVRALASYNGSLYAGTGAFGDQAKVWRWTGTSWALVKNLTGDFSLTHDGVISLVSLNGNLYAGLVGGPLTSSPVYVYDGATWLISTTIANCDYAKLDLIDDKLGASGCNGQVYRLDGSLWNAIGTIGHIENYSRHHAQPSFSC